MKRASRLAIILAFSVLLLFLASNAAPSLPLAHTSFRVRNANDTHILSDVSAPWWDSSFTYRRFINFTEPDVSDRNLAPVHLLLAFENGRCYTNSIRIMYFQDPQWVAIPFQLWNTTFYSGGQFIESTRVSFMVNATRAVSETNFYVYYAKTDIGSVSYPNFHPFIYKSTTFSLINLVSYYDDNNYVVEMWDPTLDVWDDPRIVDARWGAGGVSPTNVPSGTLDKYESIRYEPTATDYSNFWGFYAVYSNYPLSVTMGTGDMNLNPGVSDWYPSVDEMGDGVSTRFILGGVEGYEDGNEGKYWVQAQMADTEVYVWTVAETPDSGWKFFNDSDVLSWPAMLDAGEYIFKRDVIYTTYMLVNSTKPVSVRSGDSDVTYARDCGGYFSSITGQLVGEEFYAIDMGQRKDNTRVTNIGPTAVTVEWWRDDGTGWVKGTDLNIAANGSAYISRGSSSATDPDDILHIKGPPGSQLFVEGVYDPPKIKDYGDWAPTLTGMRFGTNYRIWGGSGMKFTVIAWENAHVDIMGWNNAQLDIPAGAVDVFMPLSNQHSLYNIVSNASISIVSAGVFDTGTEEPSGDQGYGWMVPAYSSQGDEAGLLIAIGTESIQATLEISVVDLDSQPVEDATVILYNTDNSIWLDGNGFNRSGTTDATGQIVFENLANQTYRIRTSIDAASWLSTSFTNIWVKNTTDQSLTGKITSVEITLQLADIDVHLEDIMSKSMNDAIDEDTWLGLHNGTGPNGDYIAQGLTNDTGWVHFDSVPTLYRIGGDS
ncbi:MAG: carboxypeptidase-like regulatory domain-containing protein, partial [Promethearchaeota archaeon]